MNLKSLFFMLCFTCAASPGSLEAMALQSTRNAMQAQKNWPAFIKNISAKPLIGLKHLCLRRPLLTATGITAAAGISALCFYLARNYIFTHLAEHTQTQPLAKKLLDWKIISTSTADYFSVMPMTYATKNKMLNAITYLAKELKVDITQCDDNSYNKTPLYYALENEDLDSIKLLIGTNKAIVNAHCWRADTPLTLALEKGNLKIIKYLIEEGNAALSLESKHTYKIPPPFIKLFQLYLSAPNDQLRNNFFEIIEHCVKTGKDNLGKLYYSKQFLNDSNIFYSLDCDNNKKPNLPFDVIFKTYFDAKDQKQREYSFKIIRCCIEQCPNKEEQITRLYTALYESIKKCSKEAVSQLIDIAKKYAIPLGKKQEITLLSGKKCKKYSVSLLEEAFNEYTGNSSAFPDIVKPLFEITSTEVCTKNDLYDALCSAIKSHGCRSRYDDDDPQNNQLALFNIIKQYLETNLFDDSLLDLLEYAIDNEAPEVVELLIKTIKTDKFDLKKEGPSLLCQAIKKSNLKLVRTLVESKQFDINKKSSDSIRGATPLHNALKSYLSVVKKHPDWSYAGQDYARHVYFDIIDYLINTAKVDITSDLNSCKLCKNGSDSLLYDALSLYNSEEESVKHSELLEIIKNLLKMYSSSNPLSFNFDKLLGLMIATYASTTDQKDRDELFKALNIFITTKKITTEHLESELYSATGHWLKRTDDVYTKYTPLGLAINNNLFEIVKLLIDTKNDSINTPYLVGNFNFKPLDHAIRTASLDIIKYIVERGGIREGTIPQSTSQEIKNYLALAEDCHKLETNPETFEDFTTSYLENDAYYKDALRLLFISGSKKTITKVYQFVETFMSTQTEEEREETKKVIANIIKDVASPHSLFWNIELPVRLPAQKRFTQKLHQIKEKENKGTAPCAKKLNDISFHFKSELNPWT